MPVVVLIWSVSFEKKSLKNRELLQFLKIIKTKGISVFYLEELLITKMKEDNS